MGNRGLYTMGKLTIVLLASLAISACIGQTESDEDRLRDSIKGFEERNKLACTLKELGQSDYHWCESTVPFGERIAEYRRKTREHERKEDEICEVIYANLDFHRACVGNEAPIARIRENGRASEKIHEKVREHLPSGM